MYRKFNTCDNLTYVNFRIHDIAVCPLSTISTTQMDWWQLISFDNPDDKFRVVRNLCIIVSICEYDNIEIEALSQRDTTK